MINKIELIKKIINNLKKFNKNTLIHIYNNYLMNLLKIKGGGPYPRAVIRPFKVFTQKDINKERNRDVFIPQQPNAPPVYVGERIRQLETQNPTTVRNSDRIKVNSLDRATTTIKPPNSRPRVNFDLATEPMQQQRIQQQPQKTFNKINFEKLNTKFNEFEEKGLFYEDLYNKEITYQHSYDAYRIFSILKHMYEKQNSQYLTNTVEIFQILDKYYIKDVFKFVEKYFKQYLKDVRFSYDIKKDKIYFKINNNNGIIIYNIPFNRLDIYFKRNKVKSSTDQPIQSKGLVVITPPRQGDKQIYKSPPPPPRRSPITGTTPPGAPGAITSPSKAPGAITSPSKAPAPGAITSPPIKRSDSK